MNCWTSAATHRFPPDPATRQIDAMTLRRTRNRRATAAIIVLALALGVPAAAADPAANAADPARPTS